MKNVARIAIALFSLSILGTLGFVLIEGWPVFDALYMTVITLTTVGYLEVHPLSNAGRVFVMLLLMMGLGIALYGVAQIGELVVRIELRDWVEKRRMGNVIRNMQGHFIVCGFGRMGRAICYRLASKGRPFLAIDREEPNLAECQQQGWPYLIGDATDDRMLTTAGILRAGGLAAVLNTDADNLYVVLSARLLSKDLRIVSRATDERNVAKMQKAGANRVISIYDHGASKMAQLLMNPNLEDFIEVFTTPGGELDLAEIHITAGGPYAGRALKNTDFRERGIMIVGIRRAGGKLTLAPESSAVLQPDDRLIALGRADAMGKVIAS